MPIVKEGYAGMQKGIEKFSLTYRFNTKNFDEQGFVAMFGWVSPIEYFEDVLCEYYYEPIDVFEFNQFKCEKSKSYILRGDFDPKRTGIWLRYELKPEEKTYYSHEDVLIAYESYTEERIVKIRKFGNRFHITNLDPTIESSILPTGLANSLYLLKTREVKKITYDPVTGEMEIELYDGTHYNTRMLVDLGYNVVVEGYLYGGDIEVRSINKRAFTIRKNRPSIIKVRYKRDGLHCGIGEFTWGNKNVIRIVLGTRIDWTKK